MAFIPAQYSSQHRERKVHQRVVNRAGVRTNFTWKREEFRRFYTIRAAFGIVNGF
jgi:hypothetical protein